MHLVRAGFNGNLRENFTAIVVSKSQSYLCSALCYHLPPTRFEFIRRILHVTGGLKNGR